MKSPTRTEAGPLVYGKVNKREAAVLEFSHQVAAVEWDYAVDGAGTSPSFGVKLPAGAIVTDCWVDTQTPLAGATVEFAVGGLALNATVALGSAAITKLTLLGSAAALARSGEIAATFSAGPSAGKFRLYVAFLVKP